MTTLHYILRCLAIYASEFPSFVLSGAASSSSSIILPPPFPVRRSLPSSINVSKLISLLFSSSVSSISSSSSTYKVVLSKISVILFPQSSKRYATTQRTKGDLLVKINLKHLHKGELVRVAIEPTKHGSVSQYAVSRKPLADTTNLDCFLSCLEFGETY